MALQFQTVGALGPLARADFGVGLADLGLLIGLQGRVGIVGMRVSPVDCIGSNAIFSPPRTPAQRPNHSRS
jgi:hypothetical protein